MRSVFVCLLILSLKLQASVCLNMIVKDERQVIERCLQSVKPLIDYWVIVDTGSTDGTQELIRACMRDIPGQLYEEPWVNFEHNRNHALQCAKNKGDYILFIDADEELRLDSDFIMPKLTEDIYDMAMEFSGTRYFRVGLVRSALDWRWVGVLHEYLECTQLCSRAVFEGAVNVVRSEGCRSQDPEKFQKDARILEEALKKEPHNTRYAFYLAQSYCHAGELEKAIVSYQKRIAMGGWDQEIFWSKYQIACLQERLDFEQDAVIKGYIDAYLCRPTRAEPLLQLAQYFRLQGMALCGYQIAQLGLSLPMPADNLFCETWVYDYGLLFEKSICAYWIGKKEECRADCDALLQNPQVPEYIRLQVIENRKWTE